MFIEPLFTLVKTWEQLKCSLIDERIKRTWHTYTMKYFSAIEKNLCTICSNLDDLEIMMLIEVGQREKDKYYMISFIYRIKN